MLNLLLKLGQWATDHPKLFVFLVFVSGLGLGIPIGLSRRSPPQALQVQETASGAAFGREELTRKTEEGPSKTTTTERDYGEVMPSATTDQCSRLRRPDPVGLSVTQGVAPPRLERGPLIKETVTVTELTGSLTETHASAESAQSTTQTLKLTQEAGNTPGWALSVGFEDVLHDKKLRLAARRRLLGPVWVELGVIPATRAVGAGLSVEW